MESDHLPPGLPSVVGPAVNGPFSKRSWMSARDGSDRARASCLVAAAHRAVAPAILNPTDGSRACENVKGFCGETTGFVEVLNHARDGERRLTAAQAGRATGVNWVIGNKIMTPQKTITLADDVFEQVKQRAEAEGKTVEEAANDAVRLGLSVDYDACDWGGRSDYCCMVCSPGRSMWTLSSTYATH